MEHETNITTALEKAFADRGFDAPVIDGDSDSVELRWGRESMAVWLTREGMAYSLPRVRMTRQGGRLEAVRAAASAMGLTCYED